MNFEDPSDYSSISTLTIGSFDYKQVEGGANGLNQYLNIAQDHWALEMDDVMYGNTDI